MRHEENIGEIPPTLKSINVMLICFIGGIFIFFGIFIKYPDVVKGKAIITTMPQPIIVKTKADGILKWAPSRQGSLQRNELIGYIESSSSFEDVLRLEKVLNSVRADSATQFEQFTIKKYSLGELQTYYEELVYSLQDFMNFRSSKQFENQIFELQKRIHDYENLDNSLARQREVALTQKKLFDQIQNVDSLLLREGVISPIDYINKSTQGISSKRDIVERDIAILNNQITINDLRAKISQLKIERQSTELEIKNRIKKNFEILLGRIQEWKNDYLIASPIHGKFFSINFIEDGSNLNSGTEIGYVVPVSQKILGKLTVDSYGAGKILPESSVKIVLNNYPPQDFGYLIGKLEAINPMPQQTEIGEIYYEAEISFPNGLRSTFNKEIRFQYLMNGSAEIISEKRTLLERIFNRAYNLSQ